MEAFIFILMKKSTKVLHEPFSQRCPWGDPHKVLTYTEYRAVSSVFRTIDHPPPLHPASVSFPAPKAGGVHTCRVVRGWGGQYFGRRQTLDGLLQCNPSTGTPNRPPCIWFPLFLEAGLGGWRSYIPAVLPKIRGKIKIFELSGLKLWTPIKYSKLNSSN